MSEIKPRQFWLAGHHSDPENLVFIFDTPDVGVHVIEAEPVLKLLREVGEVKRLVNSVNELLEIESKKNLSKIKPNPNNKYIPIGGDFKKNAAYYEVDHAINRFSKTLEKLNTFLTSIDKGEK